MGHEFMSQRLVEGKSVLVLRKVKSAFDKVWHLELCIKI